MIAQAEALYRLQQIDLKVGQQRKRLKEIAVALEDNQSIVVAQAQVESAQKAVTPLRTKARDLELEIQSNAQKTKASEDRLYGGSVRNHKELQDLQNEIASLKKYLANLEDQELEAMINYDQLDLDLKKAIDIQKLAQGEFAEKQARLLGEQNQLNKTKERLTAERNAIAPSILPENLEIYNKLRKTKRGVAVASISEGACTGCGSS